jgi:hypothetical protein
MKKSFENQRKDMVQKAKTSKKPVTKKGGTAIKGGKLRASTLLKSLPESVEHIQIVQQVAAVLEELQNRVIDVKEEASKELNKLMKRYEANYKTLEKKVHQVTSEAKKQAQTSMIHLVQKWHEHKEKLPKSLSNEIEKIIEQIGTKVSSKKGPSKKTGSKKVSPLRSSKKKADVKTKRATNLAIAKKANASTEEIRVSEVIDRGYKL